MTKYLRKISTPSKVDSTQIIDTLNSTSKTDALSADAGRRLNKKIDDLLDVVYPIGSLYISYTDTSPASLFGGTWEQIKDTFLLACGDNYENGSTGGESEVTLTVDEMPRHSHVVNYDQAWSWGGTTSLATTSGGPYAGAGYTRDAGGGKAHNNMPPYLAVYVWKRVEDRISVTNKTFSYVNRDLGNKDIEVIEETLTINKSGLITLKEGVMSFE